jgi:hypothetical protein
MTFYGEDGEAADHQKKWYHYLVVANPGTLPGSAVASIVTVCDTKDEPGSRGSSETILAEDGGPENAIHMAEAYLCRHHPGLKKIIGKPHG